jgi:hypothetical protein
MSVSRLTVFLQRIISLNVILLIVQTSVILLDAVVLKVKASVRVTEREQIVARGMI